MIIKTFIGKDKEFLIDTNELEFDKKGKLLNVSEVKIAGSRKMDKDILAYLIESYCLVEINGHYYDRTMIAAMVRGF
jgi:hypothetical protein